jgi:hypothetical protein
VDFVFISFALVAIVIVVLVIGRTKWCTLYIDATRTRHGNRPATSRLGIRRHLVFHNFAIGQGAKALRLNGGLMNKDIGGSIIGQNKAKTLYVVVCERKNGVKE